MDDITELLQQYTETLSDKDKIALEKAKEILGDSFDMKKSIGFIKWRKEQK